MGKKKETGKNFLVQKMLKLRSLAAVSLILLIVTGLIYGASFLRRRAANVLVSAVIDGVELNETVRPKVVVDPGHGGFDGGAVGADGTVEKDINLSISLYLRDFLAAMGYAPVMTRESDCSLDDGIGTLRERKRNDLYRRLSIMESVSDGKVLMIHQNQFSQSRYSGAQMFYGPSDGSEEMASRFRLRIRETLQPENTRECKPSQGNVWLLEKCPNPIVLIECGFLSNPEECAQLCEKEYQQKLAFVIAVSVDG